MAWLGNDEVHIATGGYTAGSGQVQYTVVVRGGYNSGFAGWNPEDNSTTLDDQGQMRVVHITGVCSAVK